MSIWGRWFSPGTSARKQAALAQQEQQRTNENAAFQASVQATLAADKTAQADEAASKEEELLRKLKGRGATILTGGLGDSAFGSNVKKATLLGQAGAPGA